MIYNRQDTIREELREFNINTPISSGKHQILPFYDEKRQSEKHCTYIRHSNNTNPIQIYKYINIFLYTKNNQSIRNNKILSSNLKVLSASNLNSINFGIINPTGFRK